MKIIKFQGTDITAQFNAGRWSHPESGVKYPANYPPEEIEGVTVETLPDPEPVAPEPQPRAWTPLQFLELFTSAQQLAVKQAAMQNAQVGLWYDKMLAASQVVENDARLLTGLSYLVQAGVLTQQEVDEALA